MNEIKFVKFGSLEGKKCIEKKFPGIKESDLVYIEDNGKFSIKYIVTAIYDDEIDTVSILDSSKDYIDMDEETANALNNISKDFTIYSPASIEKKAGEEKVEEKKVVADNLEEVDIIRKCGHKETARIEKTHDKDYREWLILDELHKHPLCRDCWEKDTKEKAKEAKKSAKKTGLPALKGTAKQRKWAETIRAEKLDMLAGNPMMGAVWAWYAKNYTKASEWIDARFMNEQQLKGNMEMKLRFKR